MVELKKLEPPIGITVEKNMKPEPDSDCEHDWFPVEIDFQQVNALFCRKCSVRQSRYVMPNFVISKNPEFPDAKYPEIYPP